MGRRRGYAALILAGLAPMLLGMAGKGLGKLGAPVDLVPGDVLREPAAAVRADRWDGAIATPADPVTVPLLCMADNRGAVVDCLVARGALPRFKNALDFMKAAGTDSVVLPAPSLDELARIRARQRVMRTRPGTGYWLFRTSETIGPADPAPVKPDGRPVLAMADVRFDRRLGFDLVSQMFPAVALRRADMAIMLATCRVMPDHALFCRQAKLSPSSPALSAREVREFALATYQAAAEMRVAETLPDGSASLGRDIAISISWYVG